MKEHKSPLQRFEGYPQVKYAWVMGYSSTKKTEPVYGLLNIQLIDGTILRFPLNDGEENGYIKAKKHLDGNKKTNNN